MTFTATAEVERFDEAADWFAERFPVTEELLDELGEFAGVRAWTIAGVTHLDAVMAAHEVLTAAIETGAPLADTMASLGKALEAYGFDGHALETIVRTNTQSAYNAGRYVQLSDPDLLEVRPFRQFDGIADFRQSDICIQRDGVTLPAADPWWLTNWPPLHHRCRSTVRSLATWEVDDDVQPEKRVVPILTPDAETSGTFGLTPDVVLPWRPDLDKYPTELSSSYLDKRAKYLRTTSEDET